MKPAILVVGSMNMDLVMYGVGDLLEWGTSTFGSEYQYAAGGKGTNQAFAAARQGAGRRDPVCACGSRHLRDQEGRTALHPDR